MGRDAHGDMGSMHGHGDMGGGDAGSTAHPQGSPHDMHESGGVAHDMHSGRAH